MTETEVIAQIRLLTSKQVCETLGIAERTLKKWVGTGKFPPGIRLQAEGTLKWRAADIAAFIEKRKRQRLTRRPRGLFGDGGAT